MFYFHFCNFPTNFQTQREFTDNKQIAALTIVFSFLHIILFRKLSVHVVLKLKKISCHLSETSRPWAQYPYVQKPSALTTWQSRRPELYCRLFQKHVGNQLLWRGIFVYQQNWKDLGRAHY